MGIEQYTAFSGRYRNLYLNSHSYFSLRYGTLSVEQLVALAREYGITSLALTDIHATSACFDFVRACREAGIAPVVGMEFRRDDELLYVALARNPEGFREINQFYSDYSLQKLPFPDIAPRWSQVYVIYPWQRRERASLADNEFIGVHSTEVRQIFRSRYRHRHDKLVVLQPLTFIHKRGYNLHRLLRAISHNVLLSHLKPQQHEPEAHIFLPPESLCAAFADFPQIMENTEKLLEACSFPVDFSQNRTRQTFTGGKYEDMLLLEKLVYDGLKLRYGAQHQEARQRLERELQIIDQLDFNAYFLITWDFVNYGRSRGFFHVGRGSGANSIAAYCLGITDVDPIELDLYFERFLNPKRTSPPDFDIDYSWKDRDEVIEYIFRRYRHSHTALLATYSCFKKRAGIRELGKVFGLPKAEIDSLAGRGSQPGELDKLSRQVLHYAELMEGMPNHLGIHAGGILISEAPITSYTALDLPPKGFQITQFDMYVSEDIHLHKFDVLSQRGLGHIRESVEIILENRQKSVDVHQIQDFKRDPRIRELLARGQTVGCFYVESPAMRQLLQKLRCDDYIGLVAASSIIRPGVARSGMMRAYIERHNGVAFEHLHPRMGELLYDTYGIMVYQEDVIKVVHGFAGLDLADADLLRRAMSGKSRSKQEFEQIAERFFESCRARGYPEATTQEVWRQIESFAGYSFSKAHSASFAVESYQSLFLKAHYPLEFMVGVINNFGGFYDVELYLHEARRWGATVHAPCVNTSTCHTRIIGTDIYLGFVHLKDLEARLGQQIETERTHRGPFRDMADFVRRIPVGQEQMEILIRIGALRFTGKTKYTLMWEMHYHIKSQKIRLPDVLFVPSGETYALPDLPVSPLEDAYDEMELLGFPLCSPFSLIPQLPEGCVLQADLPQYLGQTVQIMGYLICVKTTTTVKGDPMQFANLLDAAGDTLDVILFPDAVRRYPFAGRGLYLISGKVAEEFGCYAIEVNEMKKYAYVPDPRSHVPGPKLLTSPTEIS